MSSNKQKQRSQHQAIQAVMVPIIVQDESKLTTPEHALFQEARATLRCRERYNKQARFSQRIHCFGSNRHSLSSIASQLTHPESVLYIAGHHECWGEIGAADEHGMTPLALAEALFEQLGPELISQLRSIQLYCCNSAYDRRNLRLSYCGKFAEIMWGRFGATNLVVTGVLGFLYEDDKHKRTYVSPGYNDYDRKKRVEEQLVTFHPSGHIELPEKPFYLCSI